MEPDKLYFIPPSGSAPKSIRCLLSQLTSISLAAKQEPASSQDLIAKLTELKKESHYSLREDLDPSQALAQFSQHLNRDLAETCSWWEEEWLYEECWPIIELALLDKRNFIQ